MDLFISFAFGLLGTMCTVGVIENAPNNDISMTTILHALTCAMFGIIGAAFGAIDRKVKGKQLLWHVSLAGIFTGLFFCLVVGMWPQLSFLVWLLPSFIGGICIYGIAVALRKTNRSVEDVDLTEYLKKKFNKE